MSTPQSITAHHRKFVCRDLSGATPGSSGPGRAGARTATGSDVRAGARAMVPVVTAYIPFGIVVGQAVAASSSPWVAWSATLPIYGGAAQLAVLEVLAAGSGWMGAAVAGLLVQARLAAYAASMAPAWRRAPWRRRLAAALLLTDAPWAMARGRSQHYYLGAGLLLVVVWPLLVAAGALLGDRPLPASAVLLPLTLGAVLAPQLRQRPALAAIGAATVTAWLSRHLDTGAALLLSGAAAALAGITRRAAG